MSAFRFAVWGVRPADFPKWRDRGVTRFLTNEPVPEGTTRAQYCAAAAAVGCVALISPSSSLSADTALPGFGGWTMPDEPEKGVVPKLTPAQYEQLWFRLKDRGHDVYGNFTHQIADLKTTFPTAADYKVYLRSTKIASFDYHIRNRGMALEDGFAVWDKVSAGFRLCGVKRLSISVEVGPHLPNSLPVTAQDLRRLVYKAWYLGAEEVCYFSIDENPFSWDVTPPDVAAEMPKLAAELTETYETVKQRQNMEAPVLASAAEYQAAKIGQWRPL